MKIDAKTLEIVRAIQRIEKNVPASVVGTFCYVAANNGCDRADLEKDLDFVEAQTRRVLEWLAPQRTMDKAGLDLVYQLSDKAGTRLFLTEAGEDLLDVIQ